MMNTIKFSFLAVVIFFSEMTLAQVMSDSDFSQAPPAPESGSQRVFNSNGYDYRGQPYPELFLRNREQAEQRQWEWSLPFLAQKVIDKGFSLPRPYGLSLIYTHLNQGIKLNELQVAFRPGESLHDIQIVDLSGAIVDNVTWQAKLDAWILPFLNVFGLVGTVKGTGNVPIAIDAGAVFEDIAPGYCATHAAACTKVITASAPINYTGVNYGAGILLATAFQNFFFAMPITYVETNVDVSTVNSKSFNMIPRLGYNIITAYSGKFGVYIGANYLDSHEDLEGSYLLPLSTTDLGEDVQLRYHIHETAIDKWNAIVGTNWELNERWSFILEVGFSKNRNMETLNFAWRF